MGEGVQGPQSHAKFHHRTFESVGLEPPKGNPVYKNKGKITSTGKLLTNLIIKCL